MDGYLTLDARGEAVYEEKKSRFIGSASPVADDKEARAFVAEIRGKYPDARHNVYAYLTTDGMTRYSDDGEPKGTGGVPVLSVISKAGLLGCAVVVTRYFGGVLLGAGGLARAYTKAAADSIASAGFASVGAFCPLDISVPYSDGDRVRYELSRLSLPDFEVAYGERVTYTLYVREADCEGLTARLTDITSGKAGIVRGKTTLRKIKSAP